MSERGLKTPKTGRPAGNGLFLWAIVLSALVALTVGPLDALLNLLATPWSGQSRDQASADITIAGGLILTVFCFGVLLAAFVSLAPICRFFRWPYRRTALILTLCPFAVLLKSSIGNFGFVGFGGSAARSAYIALVALTIAALSCLAAPGVEKHAALARGMAWCLPAFSLGALALVFQLLPTAARPAGPAWNIGAIFCALVWTSIVVAAIVCWRLQWMTTWRAAACSAVLGVAVAGALGLLIMPPRSRGSQRVAGPAAGQRNVILISIDTLRADHLGAYGSNRDETPNIDRLAAEGVVFENAYSPAPWTLPGAAGFLTGMNPVAAGTDCRGDNCSLSGNIVTLGERFRDAGYRTAAFGSNINVVGRNLLQGIGEYRFGPFTSLPQYSPGALFLWRVLPDWFGDGAETEDIADHAIDWLERNRSERFFLWVHFLDPHIPYSASPPDSRAYPAAGRVMRASTRLPSLARKGEAFPPDWIETIKALYRFETITVDSHLGRFLDRLRELDLYDDAVILLTADHGEELWDHGSYEHGHSLYDELLRVPLIFKAPSVSPSRVAARVGTTQAPRSILEAAGLTPEDSYLAPALPGKDAAASDATLLIGATLYFDRQVGILFGKRKYIRNTEAGTELLFDLAADPKEQHPLTDKISLDEARRRLDERLAQSLKLRELFADEIRTPNTVSPDLLRSLGYL